MYTRVCEGSRLECPCNEGWNQTEWGEVGGFC